MGPRLGWFGFKDWVGLSKSYKGLVARKMVEEESPLHRIASQLPDFRRWLASPMHRIHRPPRLPVFFSSPHNCCQASVPSIKSAVKIALKSPALPILELLVISNHFLGYIQDLHQITVGLMPYRTKGMNITFSWNLLVENMRGTLMGTDTI